jgi:hypothetical protein
MSRDQHPPPRDVTGDTENTASSIVACWTMFTTVAWQRFDQIHYNICYLLLSKAITHDFYVIYR